MNAESVAKLLGGQREGREWRCLCPVHGGHALLIRDRQGGGILAYCFVCADQREVLASVRQLVGRRALANVSPDRNARFSGDGRRIKKALAAAHAIRSASGPIERTRAEGYLNLRGITMPWPPALRFHRSLAHHPSGARLPAMVAIVQGVDGDFRGVHRTYLAADDPPRKANVTPAKMSLGPIAGGAVRLAGATDRLAIAEGIETALAFMQAEREPTWAALSTSGMRAIVLPPRPIAATVVIVADADPAGEAAAQAAAARFAAEGRKVKIARPIAGKDANDALLAVRDAE